MKILVLSHISELVGGAEKSLLDVFDLWTKDHDIEPEFILRIPVGTLGKALRDRGWKYYELDYTFWSEGNPPKTEEAIARAAEKNTRAVVETEKIIKKTKPDVVITNSIVCPWAALAAYNQKVPHVWFVREYGDLDHGRIYEIGREKTLQDVGNLSNLVLTNSKALGKHLGKYIPKSRITILYNPFDLTKLNKLSRQRIKNPFTGKDSLKLVATGSLTPSKGQLDVVKAVAKLNAEGINTELCLVGGNGPREYRDEILKVIKTQKLKDKVHLVGHQKNPLAFVALADVGVMASRREAFGRVTFEYMAIGKAVVGTDAGGTPEMVTPGENGYLYKRGDIDGLTACLRNYAKDKGLIEKHGKNSAKKTAEMMNSEHNSQNALEKVEQIAQKGLPASKKRINYMSRLRDYKRIKSESRITRAKKTVRRQMRAKAGAAYKLLRRMVWNILNSGRYER
ncbi:MAG TPA: glycosyltransferase [Candidatus Saccharimonadales bacterium]|nr:glycosyltransferase [Candidatus Saccharimonadales bacterium]